MSPVRILAVDDEPHVLALCRDLLAEDGFAVETAPDASAALERLRQAPFDLVLTDLRMPGGDGLKLLRDARRLTPGLPVVVFTGYPSIESAVDAVRQGAADVVTKPFDNAHLREVVRRALDTGRPDGHRPGADEPPPLLGDSPVMGELRDLLRRAARADSPVLITGESGTGKELAARSLHAWSRRRQGPFVLLDCAAVPADRLAFEMFGDGRAPGCAAAARGGTLFLDGVAELSAGLQARLLRALDEGWEAGGAAEAEGASVRLIGAAQGDLRAAVRGGRFREDLYFRLGVIPVPMPPLRERGDDVALLARRFLSDIAGEGRFSFTAGCLERLQAYAWPGNVRELRTVVERMVCLARGPELDAQDLPPEMLAGGPRDMAAGATFRDAKRRTVERFEMDYLHRLLSRHGGHVTRAAREAGLNRSAFQRLMRKHGLLSQRYRRLSPGEAG